MNNPIDNTKLHTLTTTDKWYIVSVITLTIGLVYPPLLAFGALFLGLAKQSEKIHAQNLYKANLNANFEPSLTD